MATEYRAYLIRLQRGEGEANWRATLQNVHTNELLRYGNEREMFLYLLHTLSKETDKPSINKDSTN